MYISSLHYKTERRGKVELFISHQFIITWKGKEKLEYVYSMLPSIRTLQFKIAITFPC